ncbi:uracil-DNA glycosylase KNAG_0B03530 [Huiozyma naganishii CBS 8797]|uniref:Uracil-DNA glycosylase n=1 Tax=Huiozyma naganishii (strain ATCC MYA-139 / BCRC 22969 / CBS 8797 / KCTC 17520 / NBRC 10181 / NCYC 3082 / Yp74L-3) TaxID=1071383 RepID=J7R1V5_HUIN7|nr:hypothetical protein KNAG_0B03530 [Kazachstania naganishii CBS 8797]CCK68795.1 hypothetical protein KNAG_0B03530 [Kazachstania naganishii CBS 8797]
MTSDIVKKNQKRQTSIQDFFGSSVSKRARIDSNDKLTTVQADASVTTKVTKVEKASEQVSPNLSKPVINKIKEEFSRSLDAKTRDLLNLELLTLEDSWFEQLKEEFTKPYFLQLKDFVKREQSTQTVFPTPGDIYSWSRMTPFDAVKVVIIGQDPYHNFNQAHGLAFSVKSPTPAPPSLKNIYKELKSNYADFQIDNSKGDLSCWSKQGVLLLNTALTVRAHSANSHSKQGWETFTSRIVELLIQDREKSGKNIVFLLWGNNAIKLVERLLEKVTKESGKSTWKNFPNLLVLKSVHPSPLSASRGFFGNLHFKQINDWLHNERGEKMIDWSVVSGTSLEEVAQANSHP